MRNFQGTFGTPKRSFISPFSICVTVPLKFFVSNFSSFISFPCTEQLNKFSGGIKLLFVLFILQNPKQSGLYMITIFLTKKSSKLFMHRSSHQRCSMEKGRPATLLKRRLWYRCFPVNFVKFLRTPFFREHLWWLLLYATMSY